MLRRKRGGGARTRRQFGGVVFKEHRSDPAEDLLQFLFESAYESEPGFKPTPGCLRRYLKDIVAVTVIDDLMLPQEDLEVVRNTAPTCSLLTASKQNRLFEGTTVFLTGLPEEAGLALLARGLGRPIRSEEGEAAATVVRALGGNPLLIRQAASLIRLETTGLAALAHRLLAGGVKELADASMATLASADLEIARTLAIVGDIPIRASRVEDLSGWPAHRILRELEGRGLVDSQRQAYVLADNVREALEAELNRSALSTTFVDRAIGWMDRQGGVVSLGDLPLLMSTITWASDAGRWTEVLKLCRGVENTLIDSRRWGRWRWTLERATNAARQLGDSRNLGWAVHELGSLALCYEDYGQAKNLLEQALSIRRTARDREGATRTRHNLDVLRRLTGAAGHELASNGHIKRIWWTSALVVILIVGLLGFAFMSQRYTRQLAAIPTSTPLLQPNVVPTLETVPTSTTTASHVPTVTETPRPAAPQTPPPAPPPQATATPAPAITVPPYSLDMVLVLTRDSTGQEKSTFACGDPIQYAATVSSNRPQGVGATARFRSSGPSGTLHTYSRDFQLPAGRFEFYNSQSIPTTAVPGKYRLDISVDTSDGYHAAGYYLFTVACGSVG